MKKISGEVISENEKSSRIVAYMVIYAIITVTTPVIVKYAVFENSAYSLLSNEGWASFLGSYIGGAIGGIGTLLAMYATLKTTMEIQIENKKDTDDRILQNNALHEEEYKRDKTEREEEKRINKENREREIRRMFADDIAVLIGRYVADISKYHYASVSSSMYADSENCAYSKMQGKKEDLISALREEEMTACLTKTLNSTQRIKQLEYEDAKQFYEKMEKAREDNSKFANRIVANEAYFTLSSKLKGVTEADDLMNFIKDFHGKSSANQDREAHKQVGAWLEESTNTIIQLYADFRDKYVGRNE